MAAVQVPAKERVTVAGETPATPAIPAGADLHLWIVMRYAALQQRVAGHRTVAADFYFL
jgi:hypothetical protein